MGTFDLTKEYVVSGYWRLEFENDKEYGDYLGTLQYLPDDGCTLTLTFKNKDVPNELRTRAYPQVEISRIVGLTNFGLCHLYDAFRACLETHLSIMKRFNSMLAMAI